MAQYLIDIHQTTINGDIVQTVNARELHAFLEIGKDFSNWITDRIKKYNLLENQDFVWSPNLASKGRGGHNRKDYHLTLSVAKELSMLENNKKGREARLYFIKCERL
ncbi:antA/AntB antirepressor family protein, partial [Bartonella sp. AA86SXKL]